MYELSLHKNEVLSEGIMRILMERTDAILFHCSPAPGDIHTSIHEIRRNIKKIRAVLRLIRDEAGYGFYYRENRFYRDQGRLLSEIRSIEILNHSLNLVNRNFKTGIPREEVNHIAAEIAERRNDIIINTIEKQKILQHISSEVSVNRERLKTFKLEKNDFSGIKPGITRIHKHCRNYLKICTKNLQITKLHDFRKKIKYLLYQLQMIYFVFPSLLKVYISSLDTIADNLGIYRDLYELRNFIISTGHQQENGKSINKLLNEIENLKSKHLLKAMGKSDLLLSVRTGAFINQIEKYFKYSI